MKIAAVIPSRFHSSRFPGKPLARISGLTMIERVYRQVARAECFSDIIVATDDQRIFNEVNGFGGKAEMTDNKIESGSERVWAVVRDKDFSAVVNIQGDEPLISEKLMGQVSRSLQEKPIVSAARFNDSYDEFCSRNVVKVVCDRAGAALYFSRAPIPFSDKKNFRGFFQHVGIYGYRKEQLKLFIDSGVSDLERRENLEQLRFLFLGQKVHVIQTDFVSHGVDVPEDIEKIEKLLRA
jgi:3-deoxy-manno-octulosonate cytidylyltransferase (CMP-KDO synthetase)